MWHLLIEYQFVEAVQIVIEDFAGVFAKKFRLKIMQTDSARLLQPLADVRCLSISDEVVLSDVTEIKGCYGDATNIG
jgi:hypothetical protein